jgi:hypothetical protein
MKKVTIKNINECSFELEDESGNKYIKDFIFYVEQPKENDIMLIPENILEEINIFNFGQVDETNLNKEELVKVITQEKEYYIQRIYG